MNGKLQSSDVKNETPYNIPLLINENVISSGISLISLWHTYADEHYRVIWPRDKKKPLIANSWVAVYTVQGCGKILLKNGEQITLHGNCIIFLKPMDIHSYHCEGLVWEQYWMEFTPTSMMDIPVGQQSVIYNGEIYNQELTEVAELITSPEAIKNNLAVAFLTKIIYQWICLMHAVGKKDPQPRKAGEKDYNFHWTHTGDIWCADGMFGQTCAIVPEQNMVIAITAADSNYLETELIQKEILDPMKEERNFAEKMWNVLKNKGLRMSLENKNRSVSNKMVSGNRKIEMEPFENEDRIEKTGLEFLEDKVIFWMKDNRGTHFVEAGLDCWIHGETSMTGGYLHHQYEMDEMKIAACAYWKSENVLMMEWRYPEMAFFDHVSFEWKEDRVYMKRWVNMNSQALERPVVTAKICES